MSSLKYWLWLTTRRTAGFAAVAGLLDAFGDPESVYAAAEGDYKQSFGADAETLRELGDKSLDGSERILEQCDMLDIRIMTLQDAEYPERLKNIYGPPAVLYVKGKLPVMDEEAALTVVGSRTCTAYGRSVAMRMSYQLASSGILIVSGMAKGIDAHAHIGALRAGKSTVAVLGCGADVIYPAENRQLYEDITAAGAVITEYPPGTAAIGTHFPVRNRILSGISSGVLVVEAPVHSGSLITAGHAVEQGRDVFAVPGNIDSKESLGCNRLIREGAVLVTRPSDILAEYAPVYPHKITLREFAAPRVSAEKEKPGETGDKASGPAMVDLTEMIREYTPEQQRILLALGGKSRLVDELIETTGMAASDVLSELTLLEIAGAVKQASGKRFTLAL